MVAVRGETGSAPRLKSPAEVRELLQAAKPGEVDRRLPTWLPLSVRSLVRAETEASKPEARQNPIALAKCRDLGETATKEEIHAAQRLLEALDEPSGQTAAAHELARLKVLTREKTLTQDDLVAQIAIYSEELGDYPIDVVRGACRDWAEHEKWFPSWSELRAPCELAVRWRRDVLRVLQEVGAAEEPRQNKAYGPIQPTIRRMPAPPEKPPAISKSAMDAELKRLAEQDEEAREAVG